MTCGLSLIPNTALAVSAGALTGVASFFALKPSKENNAENIEASQSQLELEMYVEHW